MFAAQESKTISTSPRRPLTRRGFTLAELVIAVGMTAMITTALLILSASTGRSLAEMVNYVDLDHYNRVALDSLTRELRQVRYLTSYNSNSFTFSDKDGIDLTYTYSPASRTLVRTKNGQTQRLLDQCDRFNFAIYQRNPLSNRYDLISISAITNCKVITVAWSCSRSLFGRKANNEQSQTAKIVIRNKKEL